MKVIPVLATGLALLSAVDATVVRVAQNATVTYNNAMCLNSTAPQKCTLRVPPPQYSAEYMLTWPATTVDLTAVCQAAAGQRLSLFVDSLQSGNDDVFALDTQAYGEPYSKCSVSVQSQRGALLADAFTGAEPKQRWGLAFGNHRFKDDRHIADTADYATESSRPWFVHHLDQFLAAHALPANGSSRHRVLDRPSRALHHEFVVTAPANTIISLSELHALATGRSRVADCPTDSADKDAVALALLLGAPVIISVAALDMSALGAIQPILLPPLVPPALDRLSADATAMFCAALKVRFINVLVRPELLRAFMGFCALPSELALESLLFVLDVERFRHVQPSMARLLANYIYLSYIAPQAPLRVNKSSMMRDRIPCPFLPGWVHNPWVFDEVLASVGFTLKKHTLLRFERSPVGLRTLMDAPEFEPDWYVAPLHFDSDADPMAAIAAQFEPDIDVVIWVNELQADSQQMLAGLATLTVAFREQLLQHVAAQFVDGHYALCLCDGYFRLASHIAPLQKQRKIKKTRKLCSFFGNNPHEALLRQQLMSVVPPSSHIPVARAAAAAATNPDSGSGSATSSLIAEHQLLAMDSDSDVEDKCHHGWAHKAMCRPSTSEIPHRTLPSAAAATDAPLRVRSWSDTDTDDESDAVAPVTSAAGAAVNSNGRTTDEERPLLPLPVRRAHCVYNDQALNRALSMIGAPNNDSHDSASSDGGNSPWQQHRQRRRGLDDPTARLDAADAAASAGMDAHSFSVYTTHSSALLGRAARGSRFERKKRADKLREFFGRMDPGAGAIDKPAPVAASAGLATASSIPSLRGCSMADVPLSAEQRNVLVRHHRKLKALLGEQVEESVINLAPAAPAAASGHSSASSLQAGVPDVAFHLSDLGGSACSLLLTPKYTSQASSGGMSAGPSSADSHGGVLGLAVPVGDEQHERALWRRNKLVGTLGDVPSDIDTHYTGDSNATTGSDMDGPADTMQQQQQDRRQRAKKLRHFFGQSLNSEAMLMQEVARSQPPADSPALSDKSFDMVPGPAPAEAASWPPLLLQEDPPVCAQFWMSGSLESQESVLSDEATSHRSSLLATLRAHKATIIGSIRRAPAGRPAASLPASARSRTSTQSLLASSSAGSQHNSAHSAAAAVPSPGKLALLARKIKPRSDAD
ncbi:hypothetical protein H4R19_000546, partial [Coemansia spiralis]